MFLTVKSGGEGASTPGFRPASTPGPGLVVWPIPPATGVNSLDASQAIYSMAYEWAQAFLRPGRYELACRVGLN
jgi:hypothetical protein